MRTVVRREARCSDIDSGKHFRFVNTQNGNYDGVAMSRTLNPAVQVGHLLLLDEHNFPVAYGGLDDDSERIPHSGEPNSIDTYTTRLSTMAKSDCFPLPVGKWEDNHWCGYDEECAVGTCIAGMCTANKQKSGEPCGRDFDCGEGILCLDGLCAESHGKLAEGWQCQLHQSCETGRCIVNGNSTKLCTQQLGSCQSCSVDADCQSGSCVWRSFRKLCTGDGGLMDIGCFCSRNYDCRSGRCEGLVQSTCEERLENGSRCNEDDDCVSGICRAKNWMSPRLCRDELTFPR
jgi:hypothetical protein